MSEPKYTPGPWVIREFPYTPRSRYVMDSTPDRDGRCMAQIIVGPNTNPHWDENARLICAAPDLMAACEKAINWLDESDIEVKGVAGVYEALHNAISKASH